MNRLKLTRLTLLNACALLCASLAFSSSTNAQSSVSEDGSFTALEEIVVTGRKREESLQDIPVSISVINSNVLEELNVLRQEDLAALIPGFTYNQGVGAIEDRNAALPSIRGISSSEVATNRSTVSSFIDGVPIVGSVGAIRIGGAAQVEVYSGPQSAAFGRSTFAGAINYVTRDPSDELEGSVGINVGTNGTRIISGDIGGPISDTLAFQIGASVEDSSSPDTPLYSFTDGVEALSQTGENISARLVFTPNDRFKAKLTFTHDTTDDGPRSDFYASAESSFECYNRLNTFEVTNNMGMATLAVDGVDECELDVHPDTVLEQLNDYENFFNNNPDVLTSIANDLRAQGAEDGYLGLTVEEQARIVYDGYSVTNGNAGSAAERNRIIAQFDYLLENGSALQLSLMRGEEDSFRGWSRIAEQEVQPLSWNDAGGFYDDYAATVVNPMTGALTQNNRRFTDNDPTAIEENYAELRWASPGDQRTRYVVGASYYDYELINETFGAPGFNNLVNGTDDLFIQLIDPAELNTSRGIVAPTLIRSDVTTNLAAFFNVSYDFTDTITASVEGRYSVDDVGAVLPLADIEDSIETKTFSPRLAVNWSPTPDRTYYAQYAVGVNPAGVNTNILDPVLLDTLDGGVPVNDTEFGGTVNERVVSANFDSSRYLTWEEETLTNFEIGFKGSAFDGRMTYSGAVYYAEWDNALENINIDWDYDYADNDFVGQLVTDIDPTGTPGRYYVDETPNTSANQIRVNTGTSDTLGLELQTSFQINDQWSISANTSLTRREYTDFCSADEFLGFDNEIGAVVGLEQSVNEAGEACWVLDGLDLTRQPNFSLTIIPRYRTQFGEYRFTGSATIRHSAESFAEFSNTTKNAASNSINVNLGLSKDAWSATFAINNLLDDRGLSARRFTTVARFDQLNTPAEIPEQFHFEGAGGPYGSFGFNPNIGRTYSLRLNYNF